MDVFCLVKAVHFTCIVFIWVVLSLYYKKVGKPYSAADARHVDFPKFGGKDFPMVVDISGVRQGVSYLLQAVYTKSLGICCHFDAVLKLNFGFPISGEWGVRWGISDFLLIALQSP